MRSIRSRRRGRWWRLGVDRRWRSRCPWRGSSVAIWISERNCSPRSADQFSCAVPDLAGTRSAQAGRWVILPACQVYDAGELTGLVGVGPGGAARLSSTPSTRTSAKRAGSSDAACRHGLMWDHTVFRVVVSCRAGPAMVVPSKRNCRIARRIARVPRRARGLVRFSPQPGHPASWLHDSTSSARASGVRATLIALQTDEQIIPITTIKRHTAAGRVRHRPRSCEDHGG